MHSCASLHAANPTTNRGIYDPSLPFFEQVDMPNYLLSKYDLIFALKDDNSDAFATNSGNKSKKVTILLSLKKSLRGRQR